MENTTLAESQYNLRMESLGKATDIDWKIGNWFGLDS